MRVFFMHGGPGMNSFAEQAILEPLLTAKGWSAFFWNEPSRLRPAGDSFDAAAAYEGWVGSAERNLIKFSAAEPVWILAHCWAAGPAMQLAARHPERIAGLVLIAPAADHFGVFGRILRLAERDLASDQPHIAASLASCLTRTRSFMDADMHEALRLALNDQKLFGHYWANPDQFQASLAAWLAAQAQFDAESFFAVLDGFVRRPAERDPVVTSPALLVYGATDPISPVAEVADGVLKKLPAARVEVLENASHFVHLDRPQRFVDLVLEFASAHSSTARRRRY